MGAKTVSAGLVLLLGSSVHFLAGIESAIAQPVQVMQQPIAQAKSYFRQAQFKQAVGIYQQILANPKSETAIKIEALLGFADIDLWNNSTTSADEKLQQALKLSRQINDRAHESDALALLGAVARNQQNYPKALELINQASTIAREIKHSKGEVRSRILLGSIFYSQEQYPKALETFQSALKISETTPDNDDIISIYDWIGTTYRELKDFKQSEENLQKQQALSRSTGYRPGEISGLMSIAASLNLQKKPELAV